MTEEKIQQMRRLLSEREIEIRRKMPALEYEQYGLERKIERRQKPMTVDEDLTLAGLKMRIINYKGELGRIERALEHEAAEQ